MINASPITYLDGLSDIINNEWSRLCANKTKEESDWLNENFDTHHQDANFNIQIQPLSVIMLMVARLKVMASL